CGLTTDGTAYCWGENDQGAPVYPIAGFTFTSLAVGGWGGGHHTCGVTSNGAAYCWGINSSGQLGDGTYTDRLTPTLVSGGITFTALSAEHASTCGMASNGGAYCWGQNGDGQLGDGTRTGRSTPTLVLRP
ncbi:MAG: RCC1 repeat-containing protein, partial [Gemmatimonadaceae bacterium]